MDPADEERGHEAPVALRARVSGEVQGVGFRAATVEAARRAGLLGWVRNEDDGSVLVHAEGAPGAVADLRTFLAEGPAGARATGVEELRAKVEGHEQFAVRGVPAGRFRVVERAADDGRTSYLLSLEVDGEPHLWSLAKAPSMVPADKRFATTVPAGAVDGPNDGDDWDEGLYERGGRVAWPEAIDRGHAVFVLHGRRLRGGFALQRTRGEGPRAGWLLVKRRDEYAETPG